MLYKEIICKILKSALLLGLLSCSPLYVTKAGYHQTRLILARENTKTLINNKDTNPDLKDKIELTNKILEFAEEIGLKTNNNYRTYSDYKFPEVWVITAAPEFSLTPHTWWFPIVGTVPYKGYFLKEDALDEIYSLKKLNLDTSLRSSSAFSTLGWFDDPITNSLVSLPKNEYIITILHELLHLNIWIKDEVSLNETLANAFSYIASIEFCKSKDLTCENSIRESLETQINLTKTLEEYYKNLEKLYNQETPREEKLKLKREIYKEITNKISDTKSNKTSLNNASFIALYTYYKDFDKMIRFFTKQKNINESIKILKTKIEKDNNLKELLIETGTIS